MTKPSPRTAQLQLSENDNLGAITVDANNFNSLEQEFDQCLEKLIDRWKHLAAPNAQQVCRNKALK